MGTTPNYGFITTPATDSTKRFIDWRVELAGDDPESTLMKIDTILADINAKADGIAGFYGVKIDENGDLILTYASDDPPPLSIDDNGDLVYLLDSDTVVNLGHVIGKDGKGPYEIAVEEGYMGTEVEFYAALVGLKEAPFLPLSGGTMEGDIKIPEVYGIFTITGDNKKSIRISGNRINFIYGEGGFYIGDESEDEQNPVACLYGLFGDESVKIRGVADPKLPNEAANKQYVDGVIGDINSVLDTINGEVI